MELLSGHNIPHQSLAFCAGLARKEWLRQDILALLLKTFLEKGIILRPKFAFVKEDEHGQPLALSRFFCIELKSKGHKKIFCSEHKVL